ncbi:hypothetical protein V6N13_138834 [Hibiscus sabdariffa]
MSLPLPLPAPPQQSLPHVRPTASTGQSTPTPTECFFWFRMQITTERYHTLLIKNSSVYSCGSSLCGVLGHGPETTQCVAFTRINFPSPANVIQMSASQNHAAFVLQSGEEGIRSSMSKFSMFLGLKDTLGELPSREASQFRSQAALLQSVNWEFASDLYFTKKSN